MNNHFTKKDTNIIKGMAIIFLMIHHCFLSPKRYPNMDISFYPLTEVIVNYIASFLKICVPIFVFLTAYGITISLKNKYNSLIIDNEDFISYSIKRYIKLFMGWIIVFISCVVFCQIYNGQPGDVYGGFNLKGLIYLFIDGTGLSNLLGTPTLVGTWWYMSLAFTLIVIIPLLIKCYQHLGFVYLFLVFSFLARQLNLLDSSLIQWLPAVILGIFFADKNLLVKFRDFSIIKNSMVLNKCLKFTLELLIILAMIVFRQSGFSSIFFEIKNGLIPVFIICYIYEFIAPIKIINTMLAYIGKHSMNIFLIHTIIRANCFRDFTYSFKYPILIITVLLLISLLISIILEGIKRLINYNKLTNLIISKVNIK